VFIRKEKMSTDEYSRFLTGLYNFQGKDMGSIASLLKEKDIEAIDSAIADLETESSGDRMQIIIHRYYGIQGEPTTLKNIGESFRKPISGERVRSLRGKAEHSLRKNPLLRPIIERIIAAGVKSDSDFLIKQTLNLPSLAELQAFHSTLREPGVKWRSVNVTIAGFSIRTAMCLKYENITTIGQLCDKTKVELLRIPNFGRKSLREVQDFLGTYGLTLRF